MIIAKNHKKHLKAREIDPKNHKCSHFLSKDD